MGKKDNLKKKLGWWVREKWGELNVPFLKEAAVI